MTPLDVLIVDDSPTVRAVLRRLVSRASDLRLVGEAEDGERAVELALSLRPDVIVMDLHLPGLSGATATERIHSQRPTPIVVFTSASDRRAVVEAFRATARGVVGVFSKPHDPAQWEQVGESLLATLRGVRHVARESRTPLSDRRELIYRQRLRWIGIGASTGGPAALAEILSGLGGSFAAGIAVVQHIAEGFEEGLAEWLRQLTSLDIAVAGDGDELAPAVVRIAPPGAHLRVENGLVRLDRTSPRWCGHRPSVNALFESMASLPGAATAGILLSGMGADGVNGMEILRRQGALTLVQDEVSCSVFGMPRAAVDRGVVDAVLTPQEIAVVLRRGAEE